MKKLNKETKRLFRNRNKVKKNFLKTDIEYQFFKSLKNISAQIIDDKNKKTLISVSSTEKDIKSQKKKKTETSVLLGEILAKRASEKK